jgi:flagellar FliL protein
MAEEETTEEQPKKKSPILLIILIVVGALVTLVVTVLITLLAVGFFDEKPEDAAQEIIEQAEAEVEAVDETEAGDTVEILDDQGLPTGEFEKKAPPPPEKVVKDASQQTRFEHRYYELAKPFVSNVANSRKVMSATVAIMTQYDEQVIINVEKHEFALRSASLDVMRQHTEDDLKKPEFRVELAEKIRITMNALLERYEDFGGIDEVYFTEFVVQ